MAAYLNALLKFGLYRRYLNNSVLNQSLVLTLFLKSVFAMHCYAYAIARCLCVRPSVTVVYSVETSKYIFTIFSLSDSQTILVF